MQKLTSQNRLALIFSLSVFAFLVVISVVFFVIFRLMLLYEAKGQLNGEVKEIINSHVIITDGKIGFARDSQGTYLREELTDKDFSALFLDKNLEVSGSFGVFDYYNKADNSSVTTLAK